MPPGGSPKSCFVVAAPAPQRQTRASRRSSVWSRRTSDARSDAIGLAQPLAAVGGLALLLDFDDRPVGVVETTEVRVVRAGDVDLDFARDEGEGFETVAEWREAHERFFERPLPAETPIVAIRFRLVERL